MSVSRSKGGGKARPLLAGSLSVEGTASRDVPSISESEGGGGGGRLRRHSTTSKDSREVDGSLRKVSKWFRDIKLKMDPIKVKDKIRYSRSSLVTQASVAEEEEYALQSIEKTATLRSRKPRVKSMEKRFSSLECLPGSHQSAPPATAIRKMNSLQFEAENSDPDGGLEELPQDINNIIINNRIDAETTETLSASSTLSAQSDRLTEEIERKLDEKEKLLEEILQLNLDSGWPSHRRCSSSSSSSSSSSKMKFHLLESVYLANELTRLVNGCIRPDHLFPQHPTSQPRATDDELEEDTCNYVRVPSKLADVINRLHDQLTSLMKSEEQSCREMKILREEMKAFLSASRQTRRINETMIKETDDVSSELLYNRLKKRSSSSSLSDSECFLSLIRDLSEIN